MNTVRIVPKFTKPGGSPGCNFFCFSKLDVLEAHLSDEGLKRWSVRCKVQTLCFSAGGWGGGWDLEFVFPSTGSHPVGVGVYGRILSPPAFLISM